MEQEKKYIRFLIADDAIFMQRVVKDTLKDAGYSKILTAYSGNDTLELFNMSEPDIVFLDINMPDGDGITTLIRIKEMNKDAICIIVSALDQDDIKEKAMQHGAFRYITKPFKREQIVQAVDDALASKEGK